VKRWRVAIVGAGWSGLAAAVSATNAGHQVTVFEASRSLGGRARCLPASSQALLPDGSAAVLDNGQHILIGAYQETLALMYQLGLSPGKLLLRVPLNLRFDDGCGLRLPDWPRPWNMVAGLALASGWSLSDKWSLVKALRAWRKRGFQCDASATVADLCKDLHTAVVEDLIAPLCISALNTPPQVASAQVFLTVLNDCLFTEPAAPAPDATDPWTAAGSDLLLPRVDLGRLLPEAAAAWLQARGAQVHLGQRCEAPQWSAGQWQLNGQGFDKVIWATAPQHALQVFSAYQPLAPHNLGLHLKRWLRQARGLTYQSIATVYAHAPGLVLPQALMGLRSSPLAPAQVVIDRGQLDGPAGLMALVVSAPQGSYENLEDMVIAQANKALEPWLGTARLSPVQTVVEKQATFSCVPGLSRPQQRVAPGLLACGDYLYAPYPATLEGAVRSGIMAALALNEAEGFVWKE